MLPTLSPRRAAREACVTPIAPSPNTAPTAAPATAPRRTAARLFRRLSGTVAAGVAVIALIVVGVPAAAAAAPVGTTSSTASAATKSTGDRGLFGSQDPTYDGVFRQAEAIGGLRAAGVAVPRPAISWLLAQQCVDGSFTSYRPEPDTGCAPGSWDSNASAAAVQALNALGTPVATAAAGRVLRWLHTVQNPDGGFGFSGASAATDANSTGLVLSALAASRGNPTALRSAAGRTPIDALHGLQVPCSAGAGAGGLSFQTKGGLTADPLATSGALLGYAGGGFPVRPARQLRAAVPAPGCAAGGVATGPRPAASYLAGTMRAGGLVSYSGAPNVGQTLNAILGLTRLGVAGNRVNAALAALPRALPAFVTDERGHDRSGALGLAALAIHAAGLDPRSFAGIDYARRILATLRGGPGPVGSGATTAATLPRTGSPTTLPLGLGGSGALLVGVVLLLGSRRRTR